MRERCSYNLRGSNSLVGCYSLRRLERRFSPIVQKKSKRVSKSPLHKRVFGSIVTGYGSKNYTFSRSTWIYATKVFNYFQDDTVLDWYDSRSKKFHKGGRRIGNYLPLTIGIKFEDDIYREIVSMFGDNVVKIERCDSIEKSGEITWKRMCEWVPIIYQPLVLNPINKTYGFPDLLVRSDWLRKLCPKNPPIKKQEETVKSLLLPNTNYYYVVVEIKSSTLRLGVDGKILNAGVVKSYKGQLTIYNCALGFTQGYTPPHAFILCRRIFHKSKNKSYSTKSPFDMLAVISFLDHDLSYIKEVDKALEWLNKVRDEGDNWSMSPPSVPELYPNMCNKYDLKWAKRKERDARRIRELTLLWRVGPNNRRLAHLKGVYNYGDAKCSPKTLGIGGKTTSMVLSKIIKAQQGDDLIAPKIIKDNLMDWQHETPLDFFIDFETLSEHITGGKRSNLLYLAGVGYKSEGLYKYDSFFAEKFNEANEVIVAQDMLRYLKDLKSKLVLKGLVSEEQSIRLFHYSGTEPNILRGIAKKCPEINNIAQHSNIEWVDFLKVFRNEPIVLKGVLSGFGIKDIANQMHENAQISKGYTDIGIKGGLDAMSAAYEHYNGGGNKDEIISYNNRDCRVLYEIVNYLRYQHTGQN